MLLVLALVFVLISLVYRILDFYSIKVIGKQPAVTFLRSDTTTIYEMLCFGFILLARLLSRCSRL